MSEPLRIRYEFTLTGGRTETFDFELDSHSHARSRGERRNLPPWTRLGFHQCPNCPLSEAEHPHCPVAVEFADIVQRFETILSYDRLHLVVETNQRRISAETSAEQALSSVMGLAMASSGCPHTDFFKPMAHFHLPLADEEETTFRSVATWLLAQFFRQREGQEAEYDLAGLKEIYATMRVVNTSLARRLRAAGQTDSTLNAVVLLDIFTIVVPAAIEDSLAGLRGTLEPVMDYLHRTRGSRLPPE